MFGGSLTDHNSQSGTQLISNNGFTGFTYNDEGKLIQDGAYYNPYSWEGANGSKLLPPVTKTIKQLQEQNTQAVHCACRGLI